MADAILVDLGGIIERHPWWLARGALLLKLLRRAGHQKPCRIIDVGCGWGTNLSLLESAGYAVTGLDISRSVLERLDRPERELIEADLSQDLPSPAPEYDAVLALDVIEHADDDRGVIQRLAQLARRGGHIIISVPALPELYSEFDRVQGHRRRYTPEMLRNAIAGTGIEVLEILWWGQWMTRIFNRRRPPESTALGQSNAEIYRKYLSLPPWPAPLLMKLMFWHDQRRMLGGRNTRGTSLFAVALKT